MSIAKRAINTLIIAPLIGITVLAAQPAIYGGDAAYAQNNGGRVSSLSASTQQQSRPSSRSSSTSTQRPDTPTRTRDDNSGSEDILIRRTSKIPPCPPGTAPTPNCRPWTPPVVVAQSKDDCECKMRRVNGVMMKDCYVLVKDLVHYCKAGFLRRQ